MHAELRGDFKIITRKLSGTDAVHVIVNSNTLAELEKSTNEWPGLLADRHRTVYSPVWNPGMAETWSYTRNEFITNGAMRGGTGGADGTLGARRSQGGLQVRVNMHLKHEIGFQAGASNDNLNSHIFYEGPAPAGALVFFVPYERQDHSEHYLVVAFEITDMDSNSSNSTPTATPVAIEATNGEAFIRIESGNLLPTSPRVDYFVFVPLGYRVRATASAGGSVQSLAMPTEADNLYRGFWNFPFVPLQLVKPEDWKPGQRMTVPRKFDSNEQFASERITFNSQIQALQHQGLLKIVAGQPRLLFSITNGAGDIWQGFLELVRAQTNSFASGIARPPPAQIPTGLSAPGNVARPPPGATFASNERHDES